MYTLVRVSNSRRCAYTSQSVTLACAALLPCSLASPADDSGWQTAAAAGAEASGGLTATAATEASPRSSCQLAGRALHPKTAHIRPRSAAADPATPNNNKEQSEQGREEEQKERDGKKHDILPSAIFSRAVIPNWEGFGKSAWENPRKQQSERARAEPIK